MARDQIQEVAVSAKKRTRVVRSRSKTRESARRQTEFGCPDCTGTLVARQENREGLLSFVCRVGHAFSGESLIRSKEDQLERVLWSAVETFEELVILHEEMAARARARGAPGLARDYRRRSRRAVAFGADVRKIISRDGPALRGPAKN